jgi:hypothetical protein
MLFCAIFMPIRDIYFVYQQENKEGTSQKKLRKTDYVHHQFFMMFVSLSSCKINVSNYYQEECQSFYGRKT